MFRPSSTWAIRNGSKTSRSIRNHFSSAGACVRASCCTHLLSGRDLAGGAPLCSRSECVMTTTKAIPLSTSFSSVEATNGIFHGLSERSNCRIMQHSTRSRLCGFNGPCRSMMHLQWPSLSAKTCVQAIKSLSRWRIKVDLVDAQPRALFFLFLFWPRQHNRRLWPSL